jgi:hypothetical protein
MDLLGAAKRASPGFPRDELLLTRAFLDDQWAAGKLLSTMAASAPAPLFGEYDLRFVNFSALEAVLLQVAEREKMSTRPLLIKGCSKLKERLAKVPQLRSQMHHFTEQFAKRVNVQWTGRRRRDTSTKKQQPHRQLFTPGHQTHANLFSNHADTRMRATCQGQGYSTA